MVKIKSKNKAMDFIRSIYKISVQELNTELAKILDLEKQFLIEDAELKKQIEEIKSHFIEEHPDYPDLLKYHTNNIIPTLRELEPLFEKQTFVINDVLIKAKTAYEKLTVASPTEVLKSVNKFRRSVNKLCDRVKDQVLPLIRDMKKQILYFNDVSASIKTEIKEKKSSLVGDILSQLKTAWEKVKAFISGMLADVLSNVKDLLDISKEFDEIMEDESNG